jgi:Ca-activated chloride channel family protein
MQKMAFWLSSLLTLTAAGFSGAQAQQGPAAAIVLDGSGSMAGWLDGAKASKMDMTRAALTPVLGKLPPQSAVGLVAFGHRRKGNCADVETVVAMDAGGLEKTTAALPSVATTGKGPLVQALRQAAQGFPAAAAKRSIILIHDDPDNCSQDACAAAQSIAATAPGLAIHVVTLGNKPQTRAAMACVATATGGRQFQVTDEVTLGAALDEAFKLAMLDNVPAPKPAVRPDAGPEAKLNEAGVILTATLKEGGDPIAHKVRWHITAEGETAQAPLYLDTAEVVQALRPGRYTVEARLGLASAKQTLDVADGKPTVSRFNLNAGRAIVAGNASSTPGATLMTITQLDPQRLAIFAGRAPATAITLAAGRYDVRLDDGLSQHTSTISVAAGAEATISRPVPMGRLELEAVSAENGPALDAVTYTVERDDPDAPQGRREIARSAAARPDFTLPAGTYYVLARAKQAEARQRLAISSGAAVRHTMILALSRLSLSAKLNASLSPQGPALVFRVLSLDGGEREVARSAALAPVLTVPVGRYRVEAKLGSENAKASVETDLAAGKDAQVTLDIPAALVSFDRGGSDGVIVEVADATGAVVWHAGSGETSTALLAPGRYTYRTPDGQDKAFDVKNGDKLTLKPN